MNITKSIHVGIMKPDPTERLHLAGVCLQDTAAVFVEQGGFRQMEIGRAN